MRLLDATIMPLDCRRFRNSFFYEKIVQKPGRKPEFLPLMTQPILDFMDQRIINLYDEYTHKPLSRNEFLRRLVVLTGSTAAALTILPLIEVNYTNAAVTSAEDLFTERI